MIAKQIKISFVHFASRNLNILILNLVNKASHWNIRKHGSKDLSYENVQCFSNEFTRDISIKQGFLL